MRIVTDNPIIELVQVSHRYDADPTLEHVTFAARRGEHVALLGPNGSGKTTLLSMVAGIVRPTAGEVAGPDDVAFVVQRSMVSDRLPITVRDTVAMGRGPNRGMWRPLRRSDRHIIDESLGRMGLEDLADRRLGDLSGGQRQRTLLAQALAQRASVVLLDEPEAGLDPASRAAIQAVLAEEVTRGACVVVATHDTGTAAAAQRCVLLRGGRVAADGAPQEVLTAEAYAEVFLSGASVR